MRSKSVTLDHCKKCKVHGGIDQRGHYVRCGRIKNYVVVVHIQPAHNTNLKNGTQSVMCDLEDSL